MLGVVLRRPVGTRKPFKEDAELPTSLSRDPHEERPPRRSGEKRAPRKISDAEARKAALAYEKEQKKQDRDRTTREAEVARAADRRRKALAKAQAALDAAERANDQIVAAMDAEREKEQEERWLQRKAKLEAVLRRARSDG